MDADSLFLGPVYDVWSHFHQMNSSQMAALSIESEDLNSAWYGRFARHPYYGKTGLNSGVMLMNLTRMREFGWGNYLGPILKEFKTKMVFGDQDIINIIFYYHPETLLVFPCRFNFRTDHCRYMPNCESAMSDGVIVMHGSRAAFLSYKVPPFTLIYQAFQEYQLTQDLHEHLYLHLKNQFAALAEYLVEDARIGSCGINYETNYLSNILKVSQPLALKMSC
uniref:Glucoside xylosyltransferase 1 n=1 Tax=Cacopsylla melanoneura TaxID=428564 RepID=A0A8D9AK01_9HEMI